MSCSGFNPLENGVSSEKFYGSPSLMQLKIESSLKREPIKKTILPGFMTDIFGPSKTWKVFRKQQEALECALKRRNGLMCFTFEGSDGVRLFLTAHPQVFWFMDSKRPESQKRSYEIIQENVACKLYLDLEFEHEFNPTKIGMTMMSTFLTILNMNLWKQFGVKCDKKDVLDLDSSSSAKFSHHVIYQLPRIAFQNNHVVGQFMKLICTELKVAIETEEKLLAAAAEYGLSGEDIQNLFVLDRKGNQKLFCDEGVYTKNRHFRMLGSSKFNKNIPLKVSVTNEFKTLCADTEMGTFLDSLVTYFSEEVDRVLEFGVPQEASPRHRDERRVAKGGGVVGKESGEGHSRVDTFVCGLIQPHGRLRRKTYFNTTSCLVYDIAGFRYCENIGKHHKSNNIMIVVDLNTLSWLQKCHDPECSSFRSSSRPLPPAVKFFFEDDPLLKENSMLIDDLDLDCQFWNFVDKLEESISDVPDCGMSDNELLSAVQLAP